MKSRILLVEDEIDLGNVVKQYLEIMDFDVDWCKNGKMALAQFKTNQTLYDILLIDVSMPEMDGFELANNIVKLNENTAFLFLTARNEKSDRLYGLKIGADDYIAKPFDIDELVLRIKNIIKRNNSKVSGNRSIHEIGDVRFYKDSLKLLIEGQDQIVLTPKEAELLEYFFNNENKIVKREDILTELWGENDYFLGRSLDVFISRLRKLLNKSNAIKIDNVYGVGFVLNVQTN